METTTTPKNPPPTRLVSMVPRKRSKKRTPMIDPEGEVTQKRKIDFEKNGEDEEKEKSPWRPILTYTEGFDYIKVELAGCGCDGDARKKQCRQDVCVCSQLKTKDEPVCGCRIEMCKPWQSAQEMIEF
jgi:hypothetical protein